MLIDKKFISPFNNFMADSFSFTAINVNFSLFSVKKLKLSFIFFLFSNFKFTVFNSLKLSPNLLYAVLNFLKDLWLIVILLF